MRIIILNKSRLSSSTKCWDDNRGIIRSRNGGWVIGKGVYCHGYEMNSDLVGQVSYFQVMILNATGRLVERALADWFEAIHIGLSWPDPRIWCNQIGALGGTVRSSVVAATVAGILAADSRSYGQKTLPEGMKFIQRAMVERKRGLSAREIVKLECTRHGGKHQFMGYARPVAKGDERLAAMERVSKNLGFSQGEHLALAYDIEQVLMDEFDEVMNINGYISAFLSDQEFTPQEVYHICAILVTSGVTACYVDTLERPAETFLPLRCDDMDYQGPPPRPVPLPEDREKS